MMEKKIILISSQKPKRRSGGSITGMSSTKILRKRRAEGRLGRGTAARLGGIPTTTIRLDLEDIALAREQATKRGLKYQTYIKMLVHEALLKAAA